MKYEDPKIIAARDKAESAVAAGDLTLNTKSGKFAPGPLIKGPL